MKGTIYYDATNNFCDSNNLPTFPFHDYTKTTRGTPIILVTNDTNCSATTKAFNVYLTGGKVMILNSSYEDLSGEWNFDDASGDKVDIPTLIIKKSIAKKLIDKITKDPEYVEPVTAFIEFENISKEAVSRLEVVMNSVDSRALSMLKELAFYRDTLDKYVEVVPIYFYDYYYDFFSEEEYCLKGAKYCSDSFGNLKGKDVSLVNVYHKCVYSATKEQKNNIFWSFINDYFDKCLQEKPTYEKIQQCMNEIADKYNITKAVDTCFAAETKNFSLAKKDEELIETKNIFRFPTIMVNERVYRVFN